MRHLLVVFTCDLLFDQLHLMAYLLEIREHHVDVLTLLLLETSGI